MPIKDIVEVSHPMGETKFATIKEAQNVHLDV